MRLTRRKKPVASMRSRLPEKSRTAKAHMRTVRAWYLVCFISRGVLKNRFRAMSDWWCSAYKEKAGKDKVKEVNLFTG